MKNLMSLVVLTAFTIAGATQCQANGWGRGGYGGSFNGSRGYSGYNNGWGGSGYGYRSNYGSYGSGNYYGQNRGYGTYSGSRYGWPGAAYGYRSSYGSYRSGYYSPQYRSYGSYGGSNNGWAYRSNYGYGSANVYRQNGGYNNQWPDATYNYRSPYAPVRPSSDDRPDKSFGGPGQGYRPSWGSPVINLSR